MEMMTEFIFLGSKITADGDCSREIKTLAPRKKSYDQPRYHIKKQKHYFVNKGPSSQSYGFPVVMYGCERQTIKKAERRIIDAFELWCWRRLLRVLWTARRSNQSILRKSVLNIHWKNGCWSWSSNTLATWYKELTQWKTPWGWERLKAEEGDDRGWDDWVTSRIRLTCFWTSSRSSWWTGKPGVVQSMGSQRVGHDWATELNDYMTTMYFAPGHVSPS